MGIFRNPAVIIALILLVVVLFGARRLPDVARSVGSSLKIFKKEVRELRDDEDEPAGGTAEQPEKGTGTTTGTGPATTPSPASTTSASDPGPGAGDHRNA